MNYLARKNLYNQISSIRKQPLIAYVTSFRINASANIAPDVIPGFIRQIQKVPV